MFCLQHLIRNVRHKFNGTLNDFQVQQWHNVMAESATMESFFKSFVQFIEHTFKHGVNIKTVVDIAFYVLRIHPSHWTIFGNSPWFSHHSYLNRARDVLRQIISASVLSDKLRSRKSTPHFDRLVHIILESNSEGNQAERAVSFEPNKSVVNSRICPRYGNTRNNVSESTAGTFYEVGVRDKTPPGSILSCLQWYNSQLEILFKDVKQHGASFSRNGVTIWKQELDKQQDSKNRHLFLSVYSLKKQRTWTNCSLIYVTSMTLLLIKAKTIFLWM